MEQKEEQADKLIKVLGEALGQKIVTGGMCKGGLEDPVEFLEDIAVDAPLAKGLLGKIVGFLTDKCEGEDFGFAKLSV